MGAVVTDEPRLVENDVHVIGASSLAAGHLTLVPELRAALGGVRGISAALPTHP